MKFMVISIGGLMALMVIAMLVVAVTGANPEKVKEYNIIQDWVWYRIGAYAAIVATWPLLSRLLTRPKGNTKGMSEADIHKTEEKRERDRSVIAKAWWKVAALFAFFEIVIIQQFGL